MRSPISLLLGHLYYKHNTTNEGSLKDVINECCDIINDSFLPLCKNNSNIKISLGECNNKSQKRKIIYLNCKIDNTTILQENVDCHYIPYSNIKGIISIIFSIIALLVEIFFAAFIIM